jgi:hypothetical protein
MVLTETKGWLKTTTDELTETKGLLMATTDELNVMRRERNACRNELQKLNHKLDRFSAIHTPVPDGEVSVASDDLSDDDDDDVPNHPPLSDVSKHQPASSPPASFSLYTPRSQGGSLRKPFVSVKINDTTDLIVVPHRADVSSGCHFVPLQDHKILFLPVLQDVAKALLAHHQGAEGGVINLKMGNCHFVERRPPIQSFGEGDDELASGVYCTSGHTKVVDIYAQRGVSMPRMGGGLARDSYVNPQSTLDQINFTSESGSYRVSYKASFFQRTDVNSWAKLREVQENGVKIRVHLCDERTGGAAAAAAQTA